MRRWLPQWVCLGSTGGDGRALSDAVTKAQFAVESNTSAVGLFGRRDEHLRIIEQALDVKIVARGTHLTISGAKDAVQITLQVLDDLVKVARKKPFLTPQEVRTALEMHQQGSSLSMDEIERDVVQVSARGKRISPRTPGQKAYIDAIRRNGIVFGIGPAGTGKTYLAMAMATAALKSREVDRLILTRPAVEAGESLGFLPGDLQDKVDPYLRPLYDALYDILGVDVFQRYMERGVIEVAPLAYMRGRTLDNAFIILDEAQNTTPEQMKMFLTRMGFGSKVVVTGDDTQIDLPEGKSSGLKEVQSVLQQVEGISFVKLTDRDVVRHELVQKIIKAYERFVREAEANDRRDESAANGSQAHEEAPSGGETGGEDEDRWTEKETTVEVTNP